MVRLNRFGLIAGLASCSVGANAAVTGSKPHIIMHLVDDWGWANAGWHQPTPNPEVRTPRMDALVAQGIELDRAYAYQFCSPSRCSLQSGRNPLHVNTENDDLSIHNPADPVSGFSGIPRNMTGMATLMRQGGYRTHQIGKWDAGWATLDHIPTGRGYDTSFGYAHHFNDYFDETESGGNGPVDLWDTNNPAFGMNSSCEACVWAGGRAGGRACV
jgi:arylsulfatase B